MKQARILAVDDRPENLDLMRHMLQRKGYDVICAFNGTEALALLDAQTVDLILMDLYMPNQSGDEIVRLIKQDARFVDTPVIYVSAIETASAKLRAFTAGGVDYITRPYQVSELMARIETHLGIRQTAAEQQRQIDQLRERNELKDNMLYVVAHDLQNPITVIASYVELLQLRDHEYWDKNERSREYLDKIRATALRMGQFVNELLDVMKIENSEPTDIALTNLNQLLYACCQELRPLATSRAITMELKTPATDLYARVMPQLFQQAVVNLLANAIKYSDDDTVILVSLAADETVIRIQVQDHGLGIPEDALPLIFNRFYRVNSVQHRQRSGNGLGLTLVKLIVEQNGGTISVISHLNEGSTFTIELPA